MFFLQSRPTALLCRESKAHLVSLFSHALRANGARMPTASVGDTHSSERIRRPAGRGKVVRNKGREKRCLERDPGQIDPLLPESCSGANSVGLMYQADDKFADLVPHTDRCHLCDSDSVPSQWPIMRKAQCLGYSRDGPKQPTSGF